MKSSIGSFPLQSIVSVPPSLFKFKLVETYRRGSFLLISYFGGFTSHHGQRTHSNLSVETKSIGSFLLTRYFGSLTRRHGQRTRNCRETEQRRVSFLLIRYVRRFHQSRVSFLVLVRFMIFGCFIRVEEASCWKDFSVVSLLIR